MMFIEIKEDKFEKIAEYTEKMLKYGGKVMSCLSEVGEEYGMQLREGGSMGQRGGQGGSQGGGRYGNRYDEMDMRGGYGSRGGMNYRDDEDEWEDEMNERRGVRGSGRGRGRGR